MYGLDLIWPVSYTHLDVYKRQMYDISRKSKIYIRNLSSLVQKYGVITGIVPFYEDIIIGFRANGLIRLRTSQKYEEEIVNRNIRIYGIYREPRQGLLWIASDGQGAVIYACLLYTSRCV